jgi:lipoate-protein ligase A
MTSLIRILDTSLAPARWNVAMTAALAQRHSLGLTPDTIRFHRYPACVLLGHGQQLDAALDADYCCRRGIEIARRVTGGGAVYMSPRMLAWDVVLDRRSPGRSLGEITQVICEAVSAGLARLGITPRFQAPNAIVVDGAKISGSSGYVEGRSALLQGTVLIEDDVAEMASALRLPPDTLRRQVTCLAAALGRVPALAEVQSAVLHGLSAGLGRSLQYAAPARDEFDRAERLLHEEVGTETFVQGRDASMTAEAAS